jgi:RHH-type rel operon transcriptional repressor/antitoxin RelB
MKMLSVRLTREQESALEQLAEQTGRSKSYYVKQALDEFLEDRADYLVALAAIERDDRRLTAAEVRRELGI